MLFEIDEEMARDVAHCLVIINSMNILLPAEDENGRMIKVRAYTEKCEEAYHLFSSFVDYQRAIRIQHECKRSDRCE